MNSFFNSISSTPPHLDTIHFNTKSGWKDPFSEMVHEFRWRRKTEIDRRGARRCYSAWCKTHQLCWGKNRQNSHNAVPLLWILVPQLQNRLQTVRRPVLLHLCGRKRQQSVLFGGNTQFRWSTKRVLPQCVRIGFGVQFL